MNDLATFENMRSGWSDIKEQRKPQLIAEILFCNSVDQDMQNNQLSNDIAFILIDSSLANDTIANYRKPKN